MGERRGAYRVLMRIPEGKRPLEKPRSGWEDYIDTDREEVGRDIMGWIDLVRDRDTWPALNTAPNIRVP
jgi:hypothetical protein